MKSCPLCGKEYPDSVAVCSVDGHALETGEAESAPPKIQHTNQEEAAAAADATSAELPPPSNAPEGYHSLGCMDPREANHLLAQFELAGIQFQIERVEMEIPTSRGFIKQFVFEVYVIKADAERAWKILSADWKV